jgi:hypothetical protein
MSNSAPSVSLISSIQIAELLSSTLGIEKSAEVVEVALARLGFTYLAMALSLDQALAVLDELSRAPGMVGITARLARTGLDASKGPSSGPISAELPPASVRFRQIEGPPSSSLRGASASVTAEDVASLLSGSLGVERSYSLVLRALVRLGMNADRLDKSQALAVLDFLAQEPGSVGLCARFGRARLLLRFAA